MEKQLNGNPTIRCSVDSCAHHVTGNLCGLSSIQVGCTCADVSCCESTECASFRLGKKGGCGCN